jgi:hypothetical protein
MKVALVDEQLTIAGPDALRMEGEAICPDCRDIVRLHWNRQGAYFWRHKHSSRGKCSLIRSRAGDEMIDATAAHPMNLEVQFGPVRDDDLEKLEASARKCGADVIKLPADKTFALVLTGPGVVILAGQEKMEGGSCK